MDWGIFQRRNSCLATSQPILLLSLNICICLRSNLQKKVLMPWRGEVLGYVAQENEHPCVQDCSQAALAQRKAWSSLA